MEMFNVHRRDIMTFDNYMDLKKPGFGGPASAKPYRDARGKKVNPNPKLQGYQHVVERDPAFSHHVYDSTYKAMTHDLVYKQENKKPFKYQDPYLTGIPTVEVKPVKEGTSFESFNDFINEMDMEDYEDTGLDGDIEAGADEYEEHQSLLRDLGQEDEEDFEDEEEYELEDEEEYEDEYSLKGRWGEENSDVSDIERRLREFEN